MVSRSLHSIGRISLTLLPVISIFSLEAIPVEVDKIISGKIKLDADLFWCLLFVLLSLFIYIDYSINKGYYDKMEVK